MIDDYIRSEMAEARRVECFLSGSLDVSVLWLAPGVPSHAKTILMGAEMGVVRESLEIKSSRDKRTGRDYFYAVMICRRGGRSHAGAGVSRNREIAIEFAYRNSVRQLAPYAGGRLAWQDTRVGARSSISL